MAALARALGVTAMAVNKWSRRADWSFRPPFDVEAVQAWRSAHAPESAAAAQGRGSEEANAADLALSVARLRKVELSADVAEGRRCTRETLEAAGRIIVAEIVGVMDDLSMALPTCAAGLSLKAAARIVGRQVATGVDRLAAAEDRARKFVETAARGARRPGVLTAADPGDRESMADPAGLSFAELSVRMKVQKARMLAAEIARIEESYPLSSRDTVLVMTALRRLFERELRQVARLWPARIAGLDGPAIEREVSGRVFAIRNRLGRKDRIYTAA